MGILLCLLLSSSSMPNKMSYKSILSARAETKLFYMGRCKGCANLTKVEPHKSAERNTCGRPMGEAFEGSAGLAQVSEYSWGSPSLTRCALKVSRFGFGAAKVNYDSISLFLCPEAEIVKTELTGDSMRCCPLICRFVCMKDSTLCQSVRLSICQSCCLGVYLYIYKYKCLSIYKSFVVHSPFISSFFHFSYPSI